MSSSTAASTAVTGTAADIATMLDSLETQVKAKSTTSITITDGGTNALTITAAQLVSDADAIKAIAGTYSLKTSDGALVSQVPNITKAELAKLVGGLTVADTASAISGGFDSLQVLAKAGNLGTVTASDADSNALVLKASQISSDSDAIKKLSSSTKISVTDSATNVSAALDALQRQVSAKILTGVTLNSGTTITLSGSQLSADGSALALLGTAITETIADKGATLASELDALQTAVKAKGSLITAITQTDAAPVTLTAAKLVGDKDALALVTNTKFTITLSDGLTVQQVGGLSTKILGDIKLVNVKDSDTNLTADLSGTSVLSPLLGKNLGSITLTGSATTPTLTLDASSLATYAPVLGKIVGKYAITAATGTAATVDEANKLSPAIVKAVTGGLPIVDTAANIAAAFDKLGAMATAKTLGTLTLSDEKPVLALTATQVMKDASAIAKLAAGTTVTVSDSAANIVKALVALETQAKAGIVTAITITDSAAALTLTAAKFAASPHVLTALGSSYALTIADSGAAVTAKLDALETEAKASGTPLKTITLTDKTPSLSLTAAQVTTDTDALSLISNSGLTIAVPAGLSIAQIAALQTNQATLFSDIKHIVVADTDTNFSADLAKETPTLAALATTVSAVNFVDSAGKAAKTASLNIDAAKIGDDASLLKTIKGAYTVTPTDASTATADQAKAIDLAKLNKVLAGSLAVTDTAANIAADIDNLQAIAKAGHLGTVTVSDAAQTPLSLKATQLKTDKDALAKLASGWQVTPTGDPVLAADAVKLALTTTAALTTGSLAIKDTGSAVTGALDALEKFATKLSTVTVAGKSVALTPTAAQVTSDADVLKLVAGASDGPTPTLTVAAAKTGVTLDLRGFATINDISLGTNTATFASTTGANIVTLSASSTKATTIHSVLGGTAGLTEITGFKVGRDILDLAIGKGAAGVTVTQLTGSDGAVTATQIAATGDLTHGILLTDVTATIRPFVVNGHAYLN